MGFLDSQRAKAELSGYLDSQRAKAELFYFFTYNGDFSGHSHRLSRYANSAPSTLDYLNGVCRSVRLLNGQEMAVRLRERANSQP